MSTNEARVQLATLIKELPVSKSSVFELLKNMGIERQRGRGPDGKNRVAWIAHDDAESLTDAAKQVANGSRQISDFISIKTQNCNGHQLAMDRVQLNLRLPVSLVDELKAQAQWQGITLTALVEQQLAGEIDLPASTALGQKDSELADLADLVVSLKEDVEKLQEWRKAQDSCHHAQIIESMNGDLIPMASLAPRWGITANTVSRRLAFLGIKPERQGNLRYITAEQLALGDALQRHIVRGKPMELFQALSAPNCVSIAELEKRWGISRNAMKARAKAIGVELQRKGPTLTVWPGDRIHDGDLLDQHCKAGGSLASFTFGATESLQPLSV
jgi:predicted HicB family RNase H-like nuclease